MAAVQVGQQRHRQWFRAPGVPLLNALLLGRFDAASLLAELAGLEASPLWQDHVNRRAYRGRWQALALRAPSQHRRSHPLLQLYAIEGATDWVDLPVLDSLPATAALLASLPGELGAARLMALEGGAHILTHRDRGLSLEQGEVRLQLCLSIPDGLEFEVDGERLPMREGEIWYIDADLPHQVRHLGQKRRLALVADCRVTPALSRWFASARAGGGDQR